MKWGNGVVSCFFSFPLSCLHLLDQGPVVKRLTRPGPILVQGIIVPVRLRLFASISLPALVLHLLLLHLLAAGLVHVAQHATLTAQGRCSTQSWECVWSRQCRELKGPLCQGGGGALPDCNVSSYSRSARAELPENLGPLLLRGWQALWGFE